MESNYRSVRRGRSVFSPPSASFGPFFFQGIPQTEQQAIVRDWLSKNGGVLTPAMRNLQFFPGTQTVGSWVDAMAPKTKGAAA